MISCRDRELGYKDKEDHIRDCKEVEEKKRKQILLEEKEVAREDAMKMLAAAMKMLTASDATAAKYDEEEDEEMAMARELEQLETVGADGDWCRWR